MSRFSLAFLFLCLLSSLLLAGCSRSVQSDPGTLVFLIETMPANLDPRIGTDAQSQRIHSLIFSGLLQRDEKMNPQPDLAERWENPDPLTYIFHLRRDVRFHNGRPLTSADVKYTFDSILAGPLKTPKRGAFRAVERIDAPDDFTVVFKLKEPFASFLWNVTRPSVGIIPRDADADPRTPFSERPVGTGPFSFVSKRQDYDVLLKRNPSYFAGSPAAGASPASNVQQLRFRIVPDATVRALELQKGSADIALDAIAPDTVVVLARDPQLQVTRQPGTTYAYLAFNFDDPLLARREVRQALAYATDRRALVEYLLRGQARLADSLLPPNHWAFEPNITHYDYDPARAEQLLDAAGLSRRADGVRFHLTLKTSTEELSRLVAAVLQDQWRRVGVALELRPYEFATFYADISRGNFQLYFLRWIGANNDPDIFEYVFHSRKIPPDGANRGHYRNPRFDALVDRARVESDRDRRRQLYSEVQKIVADDLPYLSLWYFDNVAVHRRRVTQVHIPPAGDFDFVSGIILR